MYHFSNSYIKSKREVLIHCYIQPSAMEQQRQSQSPPHVAILPSPGMGHLIPLAELAKLLVLRHGFTVTIITFSNFSSPSHHSFLSSLPSAVSFLSLPSVHVSDVPPDARMETRVSVLVARSLSPLSQILKSLKTSTNLVAYVIDLFGGDTLPIAEQLHIPHYMFFTSNLFMLSFMFHLPTLHETTSCEFRHLPEPVQLPGCVPLRGEDFLDPLHDRSNEGYTWVVHMAENFRLLDGILVNTFEAMEPGAAQKILGLKEAGRPLVYSVGPITRSGSGSGSGYEIDRSDCVKWLDQQPNGSVLFVSFGSGGTLSCEQVKELALGLEMSGQRFVWVVRTPSDFGVSGGFVWMGTDSDSLNFLPEGFLHRTKGLGLVVPSWAPQIEVLGHAAVGGFLTHCGWNSTLESVINGVPMIVWPLYAEQRMNAVMMVEGVKVALRPKGREDGIVEREEICRVVKELMEGEGGELVRSRVRELQKAGVEALGEEGSSAKALAKVADIWKKISAV